MSVSLVCYLPVLDVMKDIFSSYSVQVVGQFIFSHQSSDLPLSLPLFAFPAISPDRNKLPKTPHSWIQPIRSGLLKLAVQLPPAFNSGCHILGLNRSSGKWLSLLISPSISVYIHFSDLVTYYLDYEEDEIYERWEYITIWLVKYRFPQQD